MAVRWVIGRAGTGKTAQCVREMRDAMRRDPLGSRAESGALFLITPEQGTFSAERVLLTATGPGVGDLVRGSFRAQVLSFGRLAMVMAREAGVFSDQGGRAVPKPMDDLARLLLLEEIVRRQRSKLDVFAAVADRPGFVRKLSAALLELRQHGHSGATLRAVVDANQVDATTSRKLLDLAILLDAWAREMETGEHWDFEYVMQAAAVRAEQSPSIVGHEGSAPARIWVDAISAMTPLEMRLLAALGKHAAQVTITLLADSDGEAFKDMRAGITPEAESVGLFARTERLHRRLTDEFRRHQVAVESTQALRQRHRFGAAALGKIEAELFAEGQTVRRGEVIAAREAAPPLKKKSARHGGADLPLFASTAADELPATDLMGDSTGVEIWESSDPETEVRAAAQAIRQWVIGEGRLRYRAIGIVAPDLEGYHDAIARVFAEHAIPHFIDRRRGIAHHPLVELLQSAVAVATHRWDREDLLLYMKSRLAGLSEGDLSLVENYLIEHGITHVAWDTRWNWIARNQSEDEPAENLPASAPEFLARINGVREKVFADLRPWMIAAESSGDAGAGGFVRALRDLLSRLKIEAAMQSWTDAARKDGDAELAQMHEQAWREVEKVLALLETLLAGKSRTLAEFAQILESALENLSLGLIPPTLDQVLVSSVTRSRVPELEVVIILGALEGHFPKVEEEDVILSDAQRAQFNAQAGWPIGDGSDRRLLEMPFFDYVALTRAGRRLVVSYPIANRQGKAVAKSRYVQRLRDLLGPIATEQFDAESRTAVNRIATADDLLSAVATWARREVQAGETTLAPAALGRHADEEPKLEAIYNWLAVDPPVEWCAALNLVWQCVRGREAPQLSGELAARFYPPQRDLFMSISQLEKFAACPLQYFMHYTLKLRPRAEFALDQMEMGTLYHSILERMYRRIIREELAWPQGGLAALVVPLGEEIDSAIRELHGEMAQREPGYEKMRARLKRTLAIILEADRRRAEIASVRPAAVEVPFGRGAQGEQDAPRAISLPVLRVTTDRGHKVQVNGKIDRIDTQEDEEKEISVIDYKSSARRRLRLGEVYEGMTLQLPVYAMVTRDVGHRVPMAALYLALGMKRQRVGHAGDILMSDTKEFYQQFKPRGIFDAQYVQHFDCNVDPEKDAPEEKLKSKWYAIKFNKNGTLSKVGNDALDPDDYATVLTYSRWKIGALADELMSGKIAPYPTRQEKRTSCDYCDFKSLCPFDQVSGNYREVADMNNSEAVEKMRAAMPGE